MMGRLVKEMVQLMVFAAAARLAERCVDHAFDRATEEPEPADKPSGNS